MKKAKIDVLDMADALEAVSQPLDIDEPHIDLREESFLAPQQEEEKPPWWRFLFTWKIAIFFVIPGLCLILAVVAVFVFFMSTAKSVPSVSQESKKGSIIVSQRGPVYFENLASVTNDLSGNKRLVLFSIAVVPGKKVDPNLDADRDIRIAATRVVSGMLFPELLNDKGREQVKKKIKSSIEALKGSDVVDSVFITSWTIL
ncbi:MAG: flagellar basal body-associated FliL family protein [Syntrophales bacterium]|nr:flagellar basal body-associated FliL family protein [Syntrophales bacterium]